MIFSKLTVVSAVAAVAYGQTTGKLGDAAEINDNPVGTAYVATFTPKGNSNLTGTVLATSGPGGEGVHFSVSVSGLPADQGPFGFHLHAAPVPEDGNCTKTLAHLDPYERGATPKCDKDKPETCEVGDLSGKHGAMTGESYTTSFIDKYASLKPGIGAFFGNRSIVVHLADSSRLACANFALVGAADDACNGGGKPGPAPPAPSTNGTAPPPGSSAPAPTKPAPTPSAPIFSPPPASSNPPSFTGAAAAVESVAWLGAGSVLMAMFALLA